MIDIFMASDTHFNHRNIIDYCGRPFKSVQEMNEVLIENWNSVVKKDDKVFFLGDFGLGPVDYLKGICGRLNGYKILIIGNHDRSKEAMLEIGFDEVSKYPIIYKDFYMLSHAPLFMNKAMPYLNIHGHTHNTSMEGNSFFNVSMEQINYTPIKFSEIISKVTGNV